MPRAFLGVGSSIHPEENVESALKLLAETPGLTLTGISTFYRTPALPNPLGTSRDDGAREPDFLNGVLEIRVSLTSQELGRVLSGIEDALGRRRDLDKYAPRVMDLDLLVFLPHNDDQAASSSLQTAENRTHPDVFSRGFVALPLLELAPDLRLPPDGKALREVASTLGEAGGKPELELTLRLRHRFL